MPPLEADQDATAGLLVLLVPPRNKGGGSVQEGCQAVRDLHIRLARISLKGDDELEIGHDHDLTDCILALKVLADPVYNSELPNSLHARTSPQTRCSGSLIPQEQVSSCCG